MNGKPLDIFVVNTLGSGAQALCVLLLLPVLVSLRGLSLTELPQYVSDGERAGAWCFVPAVRGVAGPQAGTLREMGVLPFWTKLFLGSAPGTEQRGMTLHLRP